MKLLRYKLFESMPNKIGMNSVQFCQELRNILEEKGFAIDTLRENQFVVHVKDKQYLIEHTYTNNILRVPGADVYDELDGRYIGRFTDLEILIDVLKGKKDLVFIQQIKYDEPTGLYLYYELKSKGKKEILTEIKKYVKSLDVMFGEIHHEKHSYQMSNIKIDGKYYYYDTIDGELS